MPPESAIKTKEKAGQERRVREILRQCKAGKIQLVRFLYCGNDGVIRGKACHTRFLNSYLESGIGLTVAMQSFNMLDQLVPEGSFGPVGEIRLVPDLETFAILPHVPKSARLLCDMVTLEGDPWGACPRSFLKRMIARGRKAGVMLKAAFENEFTLARREGDHYAPLDRSPCFSTIGMDSAAPVIGELIEALAVQGVYPEQYYAELGPGQQELPVRFADDPREPALVDPDTLPEAERERHGIRRLPASLVEALNALEQDEVLTEALGQVLGKEYLAVKRSEVRGFEGRDVAFEIEHHFYKY